MHTACTKVRHHFRLLKLRQDPHSACEPSLLFAKTLSFERYMEIRSIRALLPSVFSLDVSPRAADFPNGRSQSDGCILLTSEQRTANNWWQLVNHCPCECLYSTLVEDLPNPAASNYSCWKRKAGQTCSKPKTLGPQGLCRDTDCSIYSNVCIQSSLVTLFWA